MPLKDLSGQRFGRLVVVRLWKTGNGKANWLCRCDCGMGKITLGTSLKSGTTKSCGCLQVDVQRKKQTKHGSWGTPTYISWSKMLNRCRSQSNDAWGHYGGRGISVCERWNDFQSFLADMGERPSLKYSIERIDNSKGYEPANCRWATQKEQLNNTRRNVRIEFNGQSLTLMQWCEAVGLAYSTARKRRRLGWSFERILAEPAQRKYSSHDRRVDIHSG